MIKKKYSGIVLSGILIATVLTPTISVVACGSVEACQLQLETLKQQNSQAQLELEASKNDLDAAKQRVEQTQNLIFGIADEITSYDQTISALETEINRLTQEVELLQVELNEKDLILRERLVDLQMHNKVNPYLEFLVNSDSLNDFIARNEAIRLLNDYDQELMKAVSEQRELVRQQRNEILTAQNQTTELRLAADQRKGDQEQLLTQLEVEKEAYSEVVMANEQKVEDINLAAGVVDEQLNILVALQEQLRQEQEQAQADANKPSQPDENQGGSEGGDSGSDSQTPSQQGFVLPTARGTISCHFMCTDYVNDKGHLGTDIAAATGTPTYAITDGYVILVKDEASSGGFGNMIAITHYVNGVEMVSIYGHLSSIGVSVGQRVSTGEYIGAVGNTGQSTGPHLHLELLYGIGYMPAMRDERAMYATDSANYISYPASW